MSVNIHGKQYITVAERVTKAHLDVTGDNKLSITTEVLFQNPVVIKATVSTRKGTYTGISAANPDKMMEKESPYEIAETSAVGRALAFAGYETENIASAEEVKKADPTDDWKQSAKETEGEHFCAIHSKPMKMRTRKDGGVWYDHRWQDDKDVWHSCNGEVKEEKV